MNSINEVLPNMFDERGMTMKKNKKVQLSLIIFSFTSEGEIIDYNKTFSSIFGSVNCLDCIMDQSTKTAFMRAVHKGDYHHFFDLKKGSELVVHQCNEIQDQGMRYYTITAQQTRKKGDHIAHVIPDSLLMNFPFVYIGVDETFTIQFIKGSLKKKVTRDKHDLYKRNLKYIFDDTSLGKLESILKEAKNEVITTEFNIRVTSFEVESFQAYIKKSSDSIIILLIPLAENYLNMTKKMMEISSDLTQLNTELIKKNEIINNQKKELEKLSLTDSLTGLYNKRRLDQCIPLELKKAKRKQYPVTIIMIDLNNFKAVNDTYGHEEGDRLLKEFARIAIEETREGFDYAFRVGGDEFLLLFTECDEKCAMEAAQRLNKSFEELTNISSLSYGVVSLPINEPNLNIESYVHQADKRMYAHKKEFKKNGR